MAAFPRTFPRRGEVYMVDFDPARGSEQAGVRPACIVSNDVANQNSPVVTVAAITSTIPSRQYPFNVPLPAGTLPREGTILCAQLMTVSKERLMRHRGDLSQEIMAAVAEALRVHLGLPRFANPS
ncbi:MAG TPA: type II toxin-antitoxin system PemK/MazF family toxin [Gaiellaceae bacterium]|nr:type II toxin-antitoxin system PemK/MazF family toxin [Gaiellaceae bacterium]